MGRHAANLSWLFCDRPLLDRPSAAAACGFEGVEFGFPYDVDPQALRDRCDDAGVAVVLVNAPAGSWEAGDRGLAALASRRGEHRASIRQAVEVASCLGAPRVHVLGGAGPEASWEAYEEGLAEAAAALHAAGLAMTVEPLNPHDVPGYVLADLGAAVGVCDRLGGGPGVGVQADLYHLARLGERLPDAVLDVFDAVSHVQIAGVPDRHEPGSLEVAWLQSLDEADLDGARWVGLEYHPADNGPGGTERGLRWRS
jgi:hydroxypyruvate isomerase